MDENLNQGISAPKTSAVKAVVGIIVAILILAVFAAVIYTYRSIPTDKTQDGTALSDEEKSAILLKLSQEATTTISDSDKLKMLEALK